jgi:hypothetical protein
MAQRMGYFLERQRLMARDIENSYLAADTVSAAWECGIVSHRHAATGFH